MSETTLTHYYLHYEVNADEWHRVLALIVQECAKRVSPWPSFLASTAWRALLRRGGHPRGTAPTAPATLSTRTRSSLAESAWKAPALLAPGPRGRWTSSSLKPVRESTCPTIGGPGGCGLLNLQVPILMSRNDGLSSAKALNGKLCQWLPSGSH